MVLARRNWMCPTLLLLLAIFSVANSQQSNGGGGRRGAGRDTCPKVVLKNGKTKVRSNGRVVKFTCNRDYVLVGEGTSTCLMGDWTSETPVCATKGCPNIPSPPSGRFVSSDGGAVLRLQCNPGYVPSGSPMIYCVDRFDWNGTAPLCQASGVHQSAMRCDFENDDLCGWVQDTTTDEFDWTLQNYGTPSSHLSTGPSFDHTLGQGKGGHYLFIESSSPRVPNDTARLFSPVYGPPEASTVAEGVCFSFWFHMYGSTVGQLNVYLKPESKKMTELKPAFVRSGDQGNRWRQGYIPLDTVTENFQVVIEGVRGAGYVGDSAIDDVLITKGEDCLAALGRMMADTVLPGGNNVEPASTMPPNASCSSRCSSTKTDDAIGEEGAAGSNRTWTCGCSDECLLKNTCCMDYAAFCLTGRAATTTTTTSQPLATTEKEKELPITTTTTTAPTQQAGSRPPTSVPTTKATSTTTRRPTLATSPSAVPATRLSTPFISSSVSISSTTPTTITTVITTTSRKPSLATTTVAPTTATTPITTTTTSTTTITTPTTTRSTTTTTKMPSTTVTTPTTSTTKLTTTTTTRRPTTMIPTTLRPLVPTVPLTTASTTTSSTLRPTTTTAGRVLVTANPQDGLQGDDQSLVADLPTSGSRTSSPTSWMIGTVVGAVVGGVVILAVGAAAAVLLLRARRVKPGVRRPKLRQQDQLAEDSDVRYLRDEDDVQLDLTEATPAPRGGSRQFSDFERL